MSNNGKFHIYSDNYGHTIVAIWDGELLNPKMFWNPTRASIERLNDLSRMDDYSTTCIIGKDRIDVFIKRSK